MSSSCSAMVVLLRRAGILLIEIIARALKGMLRAKLRSSLRTGQNADASRNHLRRCVAEILNLVSCLLLVGEQALWSF